MDSLDRNYQQEQASRAMQPTLLADSGKMHCSRRVKEAQAERNFEFDRPLLKKERSPG
jgi:hypothetical protein